MLAKGTTPIGASLGLAGTDLHVVHAGLTAHNMLSGNLYIGTPTNSDVEGETVNAWPGGKPPAIILNRKLLSDDPCDLGHAVSVLMHESLHVYLQGQGEPAGGGVADKTGITHKLQDKIDALV
jgi:hypothetical protein